MIAVLLADGFEEIEALTPVDMLRRAGLDVKTVAIGSKIAVGSHKIPVICDMEAAEVNESELSTVIFPGGMPGSLNLDASPYTDKFINAVLKNGGRIAAICAAPLVLGRRGLLEGKEAICYPGFEGELRGAKISEKSVVTDGNITTAKGMGVALEFSKELVRLICGVEKANELSSAIMEEESFEPFSEEAPMEEECESFDYLSDSQFIEAVEAAIKAGKISTSLIQRKLGIGYGKAATYIDAMEALGIISSTDAQKPREILITEEKWLVMLKEKH